MEVVFNGLFRDEEFLADFLVAETLGDKLDDFFFAVGQQRLFAARAGFGGLRERFHDLGGHAIVEPDFAGVDAVNALNQKVGGGLFQDHAASTQAHSANNVAVIFGGREYYDASRQLIEIDFFQNGEPVFIGHTQIKEKDVGLELREHLDALGAILSFTDDGHFVVGIEQFAETIAENSVVIGKEDPNLLFCGLGHILGQG
jgi:hypothetical protein